MTQNQLQQEITIIKEMIEKTRRDTAESGLLFIIPGILCVVMVLLMANLHWFNAEYMIKPVMFTSMALIALTSAYIGYREGKKTKVETYVKKIFGTVWMAIGACCLILVLFFPLTGIYTWDLVGPIAFVVLGIGFFVLCLVPFHHLDAAQPSGELKIADDILFQRLRNGYLWRGWFHIGIFLLAAGDQPHRGKNRQNKDKSLTGCHSHGSILSLVSVLYRHLFNLIHRLLYNYAI